jgi:hypothetical protein
VLTTFWTNDLRRLRMLAILSNIAFISYGALVWLPPVLGLHLLLLPLNTIRLMRMSKTEPGSDHHRQLLPSKVATWIAFDAVPPRAAVSGLPSLGSVYGHRRRSAGSARPWLPRLGPDSTAINPVRRAAFRSAVSNPRVNQP